MKLLNITGYSSTIAAWILTIQDWTYGVFLVKPLSIKDILEIILLIVSIIFVVYRCIYMKWKTAKEKLQVDEYIEEHTHKNEDDVK